MQTLLLDSVRNEDGLLSKKVADQIAQLITEQELKTGAKLPNEFELAKMLNVGRGTVREAVKLLVARNILEIKRGKGTYIAQQPGVVADPLGFNFYPDQLRLAIDLLVLRLHLEPWVAKRSAVEASQEEVDRIKEACHLVEKDILSGVSHEEHDKKFHLCIAESIDNIVVPKIIPIITHSVGLSASLNRDVLLPETITSHRMITDAIEKHDPQSAEEAMQRHLNEGLAELQKSLEKRENSEVRS